MKAYRTAVLKARPSSPSSPTAGRLIYAVGDVHGRFDALTVLLEKIRGDAHARRSSEPPVIVFLGDYVDRGPQSREVIETVLSLKPADDFEVVALLGNHEQMLLDFLGDASIGSRWTLYGGAATLSSYGVEAPRLAADSEGWERVRSAFENTLPASHLSFIRQLDTLKVIGDFVFVHAGIRPGVSLSDQRRDDLLWIRGPFLDSNARHEKVVVHGHTPSQEPFDGSYRIGVDTGAYATGLLTAVRLEGATRTFLQAAPLRY
jgi:serine/threonine protein phosphatase 1